MQLFTSIEFKAEKFDQIEKVLYTLCQEGWELYNTREFSVKKPDGKKVIQAKKYEFVRQI